MRQVDPVDHMLGHGPALQPVQVLVPSFVALWLEPLLAVLAPMPEGRAADHPAADAAPAEREVEGYLAAHFLREPGNPRPLAEGAGVVPDLDLLAGSKPRPPPAAARASPSDCLAGPEEHLLPLVVEVGTLVDVVEVREGELGTAELSAARQPADLIRPRDGWVRQGGGVCTPASCGFADGLDAVRHLFQGGTVFGVVGEQLVLPTPVPGLLPARP